MKRARPGGSLPAAPPAPLPTGLSRPRTGEAAQAPRSGGNGGGQQRLLLPPPLPAHTPVSREQPPGRGGRPSPGRAGKWVNCGAREAWGLLGNVVAGRGADERGAGGLWGCVRTGRERGPAYSPAPSRGGGGRPLAECAGFLTEGAGHPWAVLWSPSHAEVLGWRSLLHTHTRTQTEVSALKC